MQIYEHWLMATLQSIAWKWKKCFHHICMRWKCSNQKNEVGLATERQNTNTHGTGYSGWLECFFEQHLHPFAYVLLLQNWVWSYYAVLKISSNAEIVCHEQTVMPRVASDLQSSSRRNSGGRRLVLKPLDYTCNKRKWGWSDMEMRSYRAKSKK